MGSQTITYLGTPYQFPSDAKDDEILSFLSKQPHADSPIAPPLVRKPAAPQMQEEKFTPVEQDKLSAIHPLSEAANVIGGGLKSIAQVSTPAIAASLLKKHVPDMGQLSAEGGAHSPLVNSIMTQGLLAHTGGLESSTEGAATSAASGAAGPKSVGVGEAEIGGGLTRSFPSPVSESATGGGPSSTSPQSAAAHASSVVESTPLVKKVPSGRSVTRDIAGVAHGILAPHSPWGIADAVTSIKSILERHNAEPTATSEPAPLGPMDKGAGTYGSPVSQWGKRISETKPDLSGRPTPAWKTNPSEGTPVESVAPHTKGTLTPVDVKSMLQRLEPARGGKAQTARALMRKNVRSMEDSDLEREAQGEGQQYRSVGTPAELANDGKPKLVKGNGGTTSFPVKEKLHEDFAASNPNLVREWQKSAGFEKGETQDIGAKVRAANPEPTRAEVKAASLLKKKSPKGAK